jgi:pimeloyl-ACP methyl ester carboxylesterase
MALKKTLIILCMSSLFSGCTTLETTDTYILDDKKIAYHQKPGRTPTIIFESGLGDGKGTWDKVIDQLPAEAAVFAYDRPGYGQSDQTQNSRAPCDIATELHELLKAEKINPPYILVAHSLGGLYAYCFDRLYHKEIVGMVLLDPSHPRHWADIQKNAPTHARLLKGLRTTLFTDTMRKEFDAQAASNNLLENATISQTPTLFIFSGQRRPEELGSFTALLEELRKDWQTRFSNKQVWNAQNTGHYIQTENPEKVVEAINALTKAY